MPKVLRINTKTRELKYEAFKDDWKYFGNRGLVAKILTDEVDPKCEPLGPDNKFIMCTGLFAGTPIPTSGRLSVGAKSPLTGGIKEANAGGNFAGQMAKQDIKAIIFEDMPEDNNWSYLYIDGDGKPELISADEFLGTGNYSFVEKMYEKYNDKISVASVGLAGERLHKVSTIQITDNSTGHPARAAARGGVGAVLASKKIKGVIIEKPNKRIKPEIADKSKFNAGKKAIIDILKSNSITGAGLAMLGTPAFVDLTGELGILPVRNFSGEKFESEKIIDIESRTFVAKIKENGGKTGVACQPGCTMRCSNIYNDKDGNMITSGLEYETIGLCGSNCDIHDFDFIAKADRFCDDFGVDTIDIGAAIAIAMEEGKIPWGDKEAVKAIFNEMSEGTGFGKIVADGAQAVGEYLNAKRIPTVKKQAIAAYDPRATQGMGISYATSPQGADHTTLNTLVMSDYDHKATEGISEILRDARIGTTLCDNMLCLFAFAALGSDKDGMGALADAMTGLYGEEFDVEKVLNIGVETLKMEFEFNEKAGLTKEDDKLPDFFYNEVATSCGMKYEVSEEEEQATKLFNTAKA